MHRNSLATLLFALFLTLHASRAAQITDCGSTVGQFSEVTVSGCDDSNKPCNLVRDTNATITITFVPKEDINRVKAVVHGIIMDVPMPFPLENPDACDDPESQLTCPLTKDTTYTYKVTLRVLKGYPKMSLAVKWELQDEAKQDIVCVHIPVKIV